MKVSVESLLLLLKTYNYEFILGFCSLLFAYFISVSVKKTRSNFPPRVMGLPIVGYLPFLTKDIFIDFMQIGKKYGDVFSLKLGQQEFIILNGADAIKEAFNKKEFLGRPPNGALQKAFPMSAFFGTDLLLWKEQRRSTFQLIKELGFGTKKLEENVMEEINQFMDVLRNSEAQAIDIRKPVCYTVLNNTISLIFGKRLEYDDPKLQLIGKNMDEFFTYFNQSNLYALFPWIRHIPFASKFLLFSKSKAAVENLKNFILEEINEHLKTFNPAHIRSFVDRYFLEIEKQRTKNSDTSLNQNMLVKNCVDLCFAAGESVEASLLWFVYVFAAFPKVQKEVQKEISEIIGSDKTPNYMDLRNMPYTHAVVLEILRWKNIAPLSLIRYTMDDTKVGGYNIRKDLSVIANIWAVLHDPRNWEEPEKFKPERFLSKDGMSVIKPSYFMPFLVGNTLSPPLAKTVIETSCLYVTQYLLAFL